MRTYKLFRTSFLLLFCYILILGFSVNVKAADRVQPTEDNIVIVIDPGHGGENEGTIENGFQEKSMTMVTAQSMYDELSKYDNVTVYMTHTEDIDMTLKQRAQFAADVQADFLFSIHYNASVDHDLFGSEVWISAEQPFNAYGYQFGYQQMLTMQKMGLYLRGVKTKLSDKGTDYYGIIRESTALSIPSVIIEHCHVDEERDYPFCDTKEELISFGKADATSVAKYFGLSSSELGVDYSTDSSLPEVQREVLVQSTLADETEPDVCMIEVIDAEYDTGYVKLQVTAADYDSPLIYYDYSYDGGMTYSPLQMWPESNVLDGTYADTFTITMQIPSGARPMFIVRVYNMFDLFAESNPLPSMETFRYGEDSDVVAADENADITDEGIKLPGTDTFIPASSGKVSLGDEQTSFLSFLKVCLVLVIILFVILLISKSITYCKRKKQHRQRRKEDGNRKNQLR